jgi:hypothetical protein
MTASAMPATPEPLARLSLARDRRTQYVLPGLLILVGASLVILAVVAGITAAIPVAPAVLLGVAGIGVQAAGFGLGVRIRSLRLAVEPDYLHLTGIRVDRRYHLAPGNLARVASGAVTRPRRPGSLGRAVGRASLRTTGESVELIQLANTPSVILVPTERGRLALAPAAEEELLEALKKAARTRDERPAAAPTAPAAPAPTTLATATAATAAAVLPPPPVPAVPPPVPEVRTRPLTGIERMELEERMAVERRAAITGARREQAAASLTATAAALTPPGGQAATFPHVPPAPPPPVPVAPALAVPAVPALAPTPAATVTATAVTATAPAIPAPTPRRGIPRALPRRRPLRPMARRVGRPLIGSEAVMMAAPIVGAAVVWALAVFAGSRPAESGMDPIGAALLLCGPIALLAIFLARSRWPRLAGLTSVAAMIALALVVRALIG